MNTQEGSSFYFEANKQEMFSLHAKWEWPALLV